MSKTTEKPTGTADDGPDRNAERDLASGSVTLNRRDLVQLAIDMGRRQLGRMKAGTQYEGLRNYDLALGWPIKLSYDDYWSAYERHGLAGRVVDLPVMDTWKSPPPVKEIRREGDRSSTDSEDVLEPTDFEIAWEKLVERLSVWNILSRFDKLAGVGRYGVLVIGFTGDSDLAKPVKAGNKTVAYLRPFGEGSAKIVEKEKNAGNARFGKPILYEINFEGDEGNSKGTPLKVHWSRVIHFADGRLQSDVYGKPRLRQVMNIVMDMTFKILGGSAEAVWLNMRQGIVLSNRGDAVLPDDSASVLERGKEIDKYIHDLARIIMMQDVDATAIPSNVPDVTAPFEVHLAALSIATSIPQRVLAGSAKGELAAAREDMRQWYGYIAGRQKQTAEPDVLRPLIDLLQAAGALPQTPLGYAVGVEGKDGEYEWPSLFELTEGEQATILKDESMAIKLLSDQTTQKLPITEQEARQRLGYDPFPPAEIVAQMYRGTPAGMIANALLEYRGGHIDAETLTQYAISVAIDTARELGIEYGAE